MTGRVVVANIKNPIDLRGFTRVLIDRTTVFGNPYHLYSQAKDERQRVLQRHHVYLSEQIQRGGPLANAINDLAQRVQGGENIALMCHCHPLPCHGDTLARRIKRMALNSRH